MNTFCTTKSFTRKKAGGGGTGGGGNTGQIIPPPNTFASNTLTITNQTGSNQPLNGTYIASASSTLSPYDAYNAFNGSITTFWQSNSNTYDGVNPISSYAGTNSTTISGTTYLGEWLQIKTPVKFVLNVYTLRVCPTEISWESRGVSLFYVAGSNDGTTWSMVDTQNLTAAPTLTNLTAAFNVTTSTNYMYYRIVINKIFGSGANPGNVGQLGQWNLFGNISTITSTPNFSIYTTILTDTSGGGWGGVGVSGDEKTILFSSYNNDKVYFSKYTTSWSPLTSITITKPFCCRLSSDGLRGICSQENGGKCYTLQWTGTTYSVTQTSDSNSRRFMGLDMTPDGNTIIASELSTGFIYKATWNGTNYSVFSQIYNTGLAGSLHGVAISNDGTKVAYCQYQAIVYWATFKSDGTLNPPTQITQGIPLAGRSVKFSPDGNRIYFSSNPSFYYSTWTGSVYSGFTSVNIPSGDYWGIDVSRYGYSAHSIYAYKAGVGIYKINVN